MIKHPSSRAERIRLKQLHEKKEIQGRRRSPKQERDRNETDPEDLPTS